MKRILSLVLAALLVLSMAAFAAGEGFDERLTAEYEKTWLKDTSPIELTMFVNYSWYGSTWDDVMARRITEETGVTLNIQKPVADDNQKLLLMVMSGEVPDYVCVDMENEMVPTMIESGLFISLDDLADKYVPELRFNADKEVFTNYRWEDGKTYGFTTHISGEQFMEKAAEYNQLVGSSLHVWTVRGDYWEEIGCPDMTTPESFIAALEQIKALHPDHIGYYAGDAGLSELSTTLSVAGNEFGIPLYVQNEDGSLSHRIRSTQFHDTLMFMYELASKDLLTRDSFIDSFDVCQQRVSTGECILYTWTIGDGKKVPDENPDTIYHILPPFETYIAEETGAGWNATYVSGAEENIERRASFLSYLASADGHAATAWGNLAAEGETWSGDTDNGPHYYMDENGKPTCFAEYYALKQADWDGLEKSNGLGTYWFCASNLLSGCQYWIPGDEEYAMYNEQYAGKIIKSPLYAGIEPSGDSDEAIIKNKIEALFDTCCVKIVFAASAEEAEAEYQSFLSQAEELGLAQYEAYISEKYQAKVALAGN